MKKNKFKIGILTSGGDAPGMNAVIRAVVRYAICYDFSIVGIKYGYEGIFNKKFCELNVRSVSGIINCGGTFLYSSRCKEMFTENGVETAYQNLKQEGINTLIVVGGDGSFCGMNELSKKGINCIGIPATIDNDIACSEYTIGYDTAMNTAMEMVDKLRDTANSHHRCSIVEVMGRKKGYIALNTGIACGATSIIIPEMDIDIKKDVLDKIENSKTLGRRHFIVIIAEGTNLTETIYKTIKENVDMDVRLTILGHVQRGGAPTLIDRVISSKFGHRAIEILANGKKNKILAVQNSNIVDIDIDKALNMKKQISVEDINIAQNLSI